MGTHAADPAAHADLEAPRLPRPLERAEPPASHPPRLPRSAVRAVLRLGLDLAPGAPAGRPAHAEVDPTGALPVEADEVEALGRSDSRGKRALPGERNLARDQGRLAPGRGREGENDQSGGKDLHGRPHPRVAVSCWADKGS